MNKDQKTSSSSLQEVIYSSYSPNTIQIELFKLLLRTIKFLLNMIIVIMHDVEFIEFQLWHEI